MQQKLFSWNGEFSEYLASRLFISSICTKQVCYRTADNPESDAKKLNWDIPINEKIYQESKSL